MTPPSERARDRVSELNIPCRCGATVWGSHVDHCVVLRVANALDAFAADAVREALDSAAMNVYHDLKHMPELAQRTCAMIRARTPASGEEKG